MTRMAVWRHFEDASLEEREGMVGWWWTARLNIEREPVTFTGKMGRSQRDVVDRYKNLMIRSLDQPLLTLEGLEAVITWERTIIHDERWKRLYHSFYLSGEWRNFRLRWLQTHSPCVRCDRTCEGLRLRHTNRPPFSHTVLDEGFLRVIQHPDRFRIKCRDPRKEHAFLIEARKRAVSDKIAARPHVYSGNLTSKGGTHSVQVVSRDGVDRQHNTATQVSREEVQVDIVNVVASVILKHGLDLSSITLAFPTVEYRPNVFPGLILRLKEPKTATLIFRTGKMVCTGAKSERLARRAIHKVLRELKAKDIHIRGRPEITIQNIVASVDLGGRVDLESLTYTLERTMYEPEQFPGAVYRMVEPKVVALIFDVGKLVVAGAKTEAQVYEAVVNLQRRLEEGGLISYE